VVGACGLRRLWWRGVVCDVLTDVVMVGEWRGRYLSGERAKEKGGGLELGSLLLRLALFFSPCAFFCLAVSDSFFIVYFFSKMYYFLSLFEAFCLNHVMCVPTHLQFNNIYDIP
jgi:hypothetical protein